MITRNAPTIIDQPEQSLWHWQIVTTANGDRYFCGFRSENGSGDGRISTRIVEYDETSQVGRTESGRIYHLQGPPSERAFDVWWYSQFTW